MNDNSTNISRISIESHPFEPFVFSGIKSIVIGTFPRYKDELRFNFYYSAEGDLFWEVLEEVFGIKFKYHFGKQAVEERENFLVEKKIGMADMYQVCFRKNNLSNDESLFPIMLTDMFSIVEKYPLVYKLILTSRTEMYGALWLLKSYFLQRHTYFPKVASREDNILAGSFVFSQRNISILVPYAPLQNSVTTSGITMQGMVLMYSTCLK